MLYTGSSILLILVHTYHLYTPCLAGIESGAGTSPTLVHNIHIRTTATYLYDILLCHKTWMRFRPSTTSLFLEPVCRCLRYGFAHANRLSRLDGMCTLWVGYYDSTQEIP